MSLLGAAASWAERGVPVVVCTAAGVPLHPPTVDLGVLAECALSTPAPGLAVACGAEVIVLEVDGAALFDRLGRAELLRGCAEVWSTRPGYGVAFAGDAGQSSAVCGAVQVIGAGGLAFVAPTAVGGHQLRTLDTRGRRRGLRWAAVVALLTGTATSGGAGLLAQVRTAKAGHRFVTLRWATRRAIETGHAVMVPHLIAAALDAGLPFTDASRATKGLE